ncbi:MAG: hypothetical protein LBK60_09105 [Verrucomicrobiales bacterium]|jgi:hypothetical protein|nr:hypothetical protein [Verrucomicrobiales bacterium]
MRKEQKKELRGLNQRLRQLNREMHACERQFRRDLAVVQRERNRRGSGINRQISAVNKRREIVLGRLA